MTLGQTAPTLVGYSVPHSSGCRAPVLMGLDVRRFEFAKEAARRLWNERLTVLGALMDAELPAGDCALGDFARLSRPFDAQVVSLQETWRRPIAGC